MRKTSALSALFWLRPAGGAGLRALVRGADQRGPVRRPGPRDGGGRYGCADGARGGTPSPGATSWCGSVPRADAYEAFLRLHSQAFSPDLPFGAAAKEDAGGQLLLHASPAVLGAYARLRRAPDEAAAGDEMAELIRAMRRDLGQRAPDAPLAEIAELIGAPERERVG